MELRVVVDLIEEAILLVVEINQKERLKGGEEGVIGELLGERSVSRNWMMALWVILAFIQRVLHFLVSGKLGQKMHHALAHPRHSQ